MGDPVLEVRNLSVSVARADGSRASILNDVSFSIGAGESVGLVGESGSGKSMTSLAILGLLPPSAGIDSGQILLEGEDLVKMSKRELRSKRGSRMGMILQDPRTALDPCFTVRSQLAEPLRLHRGLSGRALDSAVATSLEQVHLPSDSGRLKQYPHQLSGGMCQRLTSAIVLAGQPSLLIADEPTTALDVTTQAYYLRLLSELQESTGFAMLLIAHDLLIVRHVCQRVIVMYAGQVVESGPAERIFDNPQHPYTKALIDAIPVLDETVRMRAIEGQAPEPGTVRNGCRFAARCAFRREVCVEATPELTPRAFDVQCRCFGSEPGGWIET